MKKLIALLSLGAALATSAQATEYVFTDGVYGAVNSNLADWPDLQVELGKFNAGFTPTAENLDLWAANWVPFSDPAYSPSGYYLAGPEWQAALVLADNAEYSVGDSLYLWAFNSLTLGAGSEWALLADANWKVVLNSPDAFDSVLFSFTEETSAVFGSINSGREFVQTALAVPVPEPATWVSMITGAALFGVLAIRRRRRLQQT